MFQSLIKPSNTAAKSKKSQITLEQDTENPNEIDENGVKILSKKEKEKLKKEREKACCSLCLILIKLTNTQICRLKKKLRLPQRRLQALKRPTNHPP